MPRRNNGNSGKPAYRQPLRQAPPPPPQPVYHAPPPPAPMQPSGGGGGGSMLGNIGSTIAQGMAFGTGSAIANRAIDGIFGPRTVTHEHVTKEAPPPPPTAPVPSAPVENGKDVCANHMKSFQECMNSNGKDVGKCQMFLDMLKDCQRANSPS